MIIETQKKEVWYAVDGRCYYIPALSGNFDDAITKCQSLGAYPAELDDTAELRAVQSLLDPSSPEGFWLGVRRNLTGASFTLIYSDFDEEYYWLQKKTQPSTDMWFSTEPNFSGFCARMICADALKSVGVLIDINSTCLMADHLCQSNYSVICEKDASLEFSPIIHYTLVSKLDIPESPWYRMQSSDAMSRTACAAQCSHYQVSGPCGAFVYDSKLLAEPCILYSKTGISTDAIPAEHYAQLYKAMLSWRC
ncbi:hypothetical protein EGW08_022865 [Elysia chlorotica]|uniref:C-type lectin domain-containing protein n=1 Tax=Elysia chlorotica TaxID=188477 RepID=A0A3S0ZKA2_ELYCH|nr:hypothetical protein EGW08_022865 [Elysia chlorotica]